MRSLIILSGAAALAAAAPSSTTAAIPLASFAAIEDPVQGPAADGIAPVTSTIAYKQASATNAELATGATGTTIAQATASMAARRDVHMLQERTFGLGCISFWGISIPWGCNTATSGSSSGSGGSGSGTSGSGGYSSGGYGNTQCPTTTTTPVKVPTTTPATTPVTTASGSSITVPSSCTPISWTNTNSFTSSPTCTSGPFEVGTYCGFINPEDPCAPQPAGSGPVSNPDTVKEFQKNPVLHAMAQTAATPQGFVNTFRDLNASVNANSYLGYKTLTSYDVQGCADFCTSTATCGGFDIYIERDPAWNPDQCSCNAPSSTTNYKCSIWGSGVVPAAATNFGQSRGDNFEVVIIGSNGYSVTNGTAPSTPNGWQKPSNCGKQAHNHPSSCLGTKVFKGPFDISVCAAYAAAQNAVNAKAGILAKFSSAAGYNPSKCSFFNACAISKNGIPEGFSCSLFTQHWDASAAAYPGGQVDGDSFTVEASWGFDISA